MRGGRPLLPPPLASPRVRALGVRRNNITYSQTQTDERQKIYPTLIEDAKMRVLIYNGAGGGRAEAGNTDHADHAHAAHDCSARTLIPDSLRRRG